MEPPDSSDIPAGSVLRSKKSLYGSTQSPLYFNVALDEYLKSEDFVPSQADAYLYIFNNGSDFMMLPVHVEDQLMASNNRSTLDAINKRLNYRFECKDQGPATYLSSINVIRARETLKLSISQEHRLEGLLR
jgi:hypothetical protein